MKLKLSKTGIEKLGRFLTIKHSHDPKYFEEFDFDSADFENFPKISDCTSLKPEFLLLVFEAIGWMEASGNRDLAKKIKECFFTSFGENQNGKTAC